MIEEWRPILGFEDFYEVSSFGRIRSLDRILTKPTAVRGYPRRVKGRLLKPGSTHGYLFVSLSPAAGKKAPRYVSHLVAEAFIGPRPAPGMHVAHNDGNSANNRPDNLRYASAIENEKDKGAHGTRPLGEDAWNAKLSNADVVEIRRLGTSIFQAEIAKRFGISQTTVSEILHRKKWKNVA